MTLIVAFKYTQGSVLASDTRVMVGDDIKEDRACGLELVADDIGIAPAGLIGACNDIIRRVKELCKSSSPPSFDSVASCLSDATLEWYKRNSEKLGEDEEDTYSFIMASPERIRRVDDRGYSEEVHAYDCDGTGMKYGYYILSNFFRNDLNEGEAKELAVYAILETSKIDPKVGEDIHMFVFRMGEKAQEISATEIEDIKQRLAPLSRSFAEEQIRTVEKVVDQRDSINDLCMAKFKFKLFHTNERAVLQIMKPCRSEGEFTSNIAALALLIAQLNVTEMKKFVGEKAGSINVLDEFLKQQIRDYPPELISIFRDIMTMRSKRFPIHTTDPKFVEVVVKITGAYPPIWSSLYLKALNLYQHGLDRLLDCLREQQ